MAQSTVTPSNIKLFLRKLAISDSKAITLQSINGMINWLTRDALYDLQLNWEHNISIMDDFLGQATRLLAAATCPAKNLTTVYGNAPPPVELAQSITTITKLSILFFRKLLRSAIKQITAQSFTTIDSNPMRALTRAAEDLCWNVEGLVDVLGYARVWTSGILEIIEGTEGRFEGVIRLITSNIFPLIPGGDNPCSVNYLNAWLADWRKLFYAETERLCSSWFSMLVTWLANWNNLFLTATKNCISAAERVIYGTNQAFDMINRTIKWLQGHEFCNIREDWDRFVPDLNSGETFDIIIESMNQVLLEFDNYMILVVFYILPLIPSQVNCSSSETSLATWLTKLGITQSQEGPTPQFITGSTLSNSTAEVLDSITRIIKWLKGNELDNIQMDWEHHIANIDRSLGRTLRYERGYYEERLDGLLMGVLHQFDTVMRLIILYILPLIPQDPSSEQNLMAWLVDWNNLFLDANKRCIRAYETYGEIAATPSAELINWKRGLVTLIATQAVDKIDGVIKWLTGHEFNNIREDWEDYLPGINSVLFGVTRLINPTNDSDDHDGDGNESEKLLRSGMKETPLQSFTEMSSHQIDTLGESARSVLYNLSQIRDALRNNDVENGDTEYIVNYMNEVLSDFDTSRLLVVFYVLPLIPDQVNHPSSQNPLTTWLVDWNHLLLIAVQNCISAVKLL
ncbi:hypothetical protein PSHT_06432, partial [Puccinia striiformis]